MRQFFVTLVLVAGFSGSLAAQESRFVEKAPVWDQSWRACSADEDCVTVRGACGGWEAVNKDNADKATAYYNHIAAYIECAASGDDPAIPALAVCRDSVCQRADQEGSAHEQPAQ